jgi:hypothetical protein
MPDSLQINKDQPIRKFDISSINRQIDEHILTLKPEDHGAVVGVVHNGEVHLAYVHKLEVGPGQLEWSAMLSKKPDNPLDYTVGVRYRF